MERSETCPLRHGKLGLSRGVHTDICGVRAGDGATRPTFRPSMVKIPPELLREPGFTTVAGDRVALHCTGASLRPWIPAYGLDRELDWLRNMDDWMISKQRYWGLALPFWLCPQGHLEVIRTWYALPPPTHRSAFT
jgi:hypothetical protein